MQKREQGLDLLRAIGFLFVVVFHSFLYNGYFSESQTGVAMLAANSTRSLSMCCNGIFLMLTGYLKSGCVENSAQYGISVQYNKDLLDFRSYMKCLLPIILTYYLASFISIPIRHFYLGDAQSLETWLDRLLRFQGVYYGWYVEMYIGLTLISPFLNLLIRHMIWAKKLYQLVLILLIITALPGTTPIHILPDYWKACYPATYYVLGAWIAYEKPKINCWLGVVMTIVTSLFLGTMTLISTDKEMAYAYAPEFGDIWIVVMTVSIFLTFYQKEATDKINAIIRFFASGSFGGYLISHIMDAWLYMKFPQWRTPERYIILFVCISLPIYVISSAVGGGLHRCSKIAANVLMKKTSIRIEKYQWNFK